jgi:hypothetical protein
VHSLTWYRCPSAELADGVQTNAARNPEEGPAGANPTSVEGIEKYLSSGTKRAATPPLSRHRQHLPAGQPSGSSVIVKRTAAGLSCSQPMQTAKIGAG